MENEKPEEKQVKLLNGFSCGLGDDGKPHFTMFAEKEDTLNGVTLLGLVQYAEAQVKSETGLDPGKFLAARVAMLESAVAEMIKALQAYVKQDTEKALWTPGT
jgi:hypothetical protein